MPAEAEAAPPSAAGAATPAPSVENERSPFGSSASAPQEAPLVAAGTSSTAAAFQELEARALRDSREELETPTNCGEGAAAREGAAAAEEEGAAPFSGPGFFRQTVSAPPLGVLVQLREAISAAGTSTDVPGPPPLFPAFLQTTPEGVQRRTPSVCFRFFFWGGGGGER